MASYRGHLAFSSGLGFVYGGLGANQFGFDPSTAVLGAGFTAIGGLLPDLDSDSGVPVRETFSLAGALAPMVLMPRLMQLHYSSEEMMVVFGFIYAFIRYGLSRIFKFFTVHRGMFHSIPAMLISGMTVFLVYHHPLLSPRLFLAAGVMIGFLSHLILDELCSVNFEGVTISLKASAGSAVKFWSKSFVASAVTYILLGALAYFTFQEFQYLSGTQIEINLSVAK